MDTKLPLNLGAKLINMNTKLPPNLRAKLIDIALRNSTSAGNLGAGQSEILNGILYSSRKLNPVSFLFSIYPLSPLISKPGLDHHDSETFESGGFKWKVIFHPNEDNISLSLRIVDTESLEAKWEVYPSITFFIYNQINDTFLTFQDMNENEPRFHERKKEWELRQIMSLADFIDVSNGLVQNDSCSIGAEVLVLKQQGKKEDPSPSASPSPWIPPWIPGNSFTFTKPTVSDGQDLISSFSFSGAKWRLNFHPNGWGDCTNRFVTFSLNLDYKYFDSRGKQWNSLHKIRILDQINGDDFEYKGRKNFTDTQNCDPVVEYMPLSRFKDRSKGYIKDDTTIIQVVFVSMSVI